MIDKIEIDETMSTGKQAVFDAFAAKINELVDAINEFLAIEEMEVDEFGPVKLDEGK